MRAWSLKTVLFLLLCAGIGLLIIVAPPARASNDALTPLQKAIPPQEVQTILQNVTAGEFACHGRYGRYGTMAGLLVNKMVAARYLEKSNIAVTSNGQMFVVLTRANHKAWFMTSRGVPRETLPDDTAEELLAIEEFFALKYAGSVSYKSQLSVLRHYAHWVELGLQRYAVDHQNLYPRDLEDVRSEGYLGVPCWNEEGYYPNPVTDWDTFRYNAKCVEVGYWSAGNFSYLPIAAGPRMPEDMNVRFVGYVLIFYGPLWGGGMDITGDSWPDGVVLVLSSDENWKEHWQSALSDAFAHSLHAAPWDDYSSILGL